MKPDAIVSALVPHTVYGWMSWVAVNNPTEDMFSSLVPVLDAAYKKAVTNFIKRKK